MGKMFIKSWSGGLDSDLELQFEPQHASRRARRRISGCKWPAPRYVIGIIKELLSKRFYLEWATRNRNRLGQKRPKLSTIGSFFVPSLFSTSSSSKAASAAEGGPRQAFNGGSAVGPQPGCGNGAILSRVSRTRRRLKWQKVEKGAKRSITAAAVV